MLSNASIFTPKVTPKASNLRALGFKNDPKGSILRALGSKNNPKDSILRVLGFRSTHKRVPRVPFRGSRTSKVCKRATKDSILGAFITVSGKRSSRSSNYIKKKQANRCRHVSFCRFGKKITPVIKLHQQTSKPLQPKVSVLVAFITSVAKNKQHSTKEQNNTHQLGATTT